MQLVRKALVWRSSVKSLAAQKLPWQLCWSLLIEVLQLPIQSDMYKGIVFKLSLAPDVDLSDALPEAVNLIVIVVSSATATNRYYDGKPEEEIYRELLLPFLVLCLETYSAKPWSGIIVVLMAVLSKHLAHSTRQGLISRPGFTDNIQRGQCKASLFCI